MYIKHTFSLKNTNKHSCDHPPGQGREQSCLPPGVLPSYSLLLPNNHSPDFQDKHTHVFLSVLSLTYASF